MECVALAAQPLLLLQKSRLFVGQVLNSSLEQLDLLGLHHGLGVALADVGMQFKHLVSLFVEFLFPRAQQIIALLDLLCSLAVLSLLRSDLLLQLTNLLLHLLGDRGYLA